MHICVFGGTGPNVCINIAVLQCCIFGGTVPNVRRPGCSKFRGWALNISILGRHLTLFHFNSTEFVDLATLNTYVSDKNVPWDVTIV